MNAKGFTLIELIVVIIILAILSVTVAPKFFTANGFSEYAYRTDILAKLHLIQTRAMQQVNEPCHQVMITSKQLGKASCDTIPVYVNQAMNRATLVTIDSNDLVTLNPDGLVFRFDNMGKPYTSAGNQQIEITIIGEQTLTVTIESQGYIHAS